MKFLSDLEEGHTDPRQNGSNDGESLYVRSHAADETARILAHAVEERIRCIGKLAQSQSSLDKSNF